MRVEPQELVVPRYGQSSLSDVLPALAVPLGIQGVPSVALDVPESARYVVMLVDGLGDHLLQAHAVLVPYLASLRARGRPITCGVPSTTATSLTCLGTGRTPGQHGMAGYSCRVPEKGIVMNTLAWDPSVQPKRFQPEPTIFEAARQSGVAVSSISPARFSGSGLTIAALRGPDFVPVSDERDEQFRIEATVSSAMRGERSLVYAYERELDHCGHGLGVASPDWRAHLSRVDSLCRRLRAALPDEVRLVITGDHGMVDIPGRNFLIMEDEPGLLREVDQFAGEGRLRQLYTASPELVAARWAERLGDHAWVRTRDQAIAQGWFGPVSERVKERFGDVLVAMRTDWAVMTRTQPRELELVGMHGSLTPAEMYVPLLVD